MGKLVLKQITTDLCWTSAAIMNMNIRVYKMGAQLFSTCALRTTTYRPDVHKPKVLRKGINGRRKKERKERKTKENINSRIMEHVSRSE
jgi:hypothetical protein